MKSDFRHHSYRSLELVCRTQALLSETLGAKRELEAMAREYAAMADWLEHQFPEQPGAGNGRV